VAVAGRALREVRPPRKRRCRKGGVPSPGKGQGASEWPVRHRQTAEPCVHFQPFHSTKPRPHIQPSRPNLRLGARRKNLGVKRVRAASLGAWKVQGHLQPSPQIEDQADGQDDAQEEDEG
jgi:hypothetical protein